MNVGDLVIMNFDDWSAEEVDNYGGWQGGGIGIVLETDYRNKDDYCHVNWSKIGLSWETEYDLEKINER